MTSPSRQSLLPEEEGNKKTGNNTYSRHFYRLMPNRESNIYIELASEGAGHAIK